MNAPTVIRERALAHVYFKCGAPVWKIRNKVSHSNVCKNMQHTHDQTLNSEQTSTSCSTGLCSVGLMKSFCPSCMLIGLVMLPFELLVRMLRRVFVGRAHPTDGARL